MLEVSVPEGQEVDDEMLKAAYRCISTQGHRPSFLAIARSCA